MCPSSLVSDPAECHACRSSRGVATRDTGCRSIQCLRDLRSHDVDMLTIGQYLQPTQGHLPVLRYVEPAQFTVFEREANAMGFRHAASGPLVRSSYHADQQAHEAGLG